MNKKITDLDILYNKLETFIYADSNFNGKRFSELEFINEDREEIAFNDLNVFIYNNKIAEQYPKLVGLIQKLISKKVKLDEENIFWLKNKEFLQIWDKVLAEIEEKNKLLRGEE